jgi:hypothetical protein
LNKELARRKSISASIRALIGTTPSVFKEQEGSLWVKKGVNSGRTVKDKFTDS